MSAYHFACTKTRLLARSPISGFLQKNSSGGVHHICVEVENVQEAMADLDTKGVRLLSQEPRIGAHGHPVVFLHPKDAHGVLLELEQAPPRGVDEEAAKRP